MTESDTSINSIAYDLIEKDEFDLAIRLLDFFTQDHMKHSNEVNKKMLIINRAQAYKWAKDEDSCRAILLRYDWSATGDNFKLAVAVLREQYDNAYSLMKRLRHDKTFFKSFYSEWPLFKEFRRQEKFSCVYEECYGELFEMQQRTETEKQQPIEQFKQSDAE